MSEREKIAAYEVFIESMLHAFQERYAELKKNRADLDEYDQGRMMGYWEILDIVSTRKELIGEMLAE